jgi:hypothetical protein
MQQTIIAPTKSAVDSPAFIVQRAASVCIAMFTADGKRPKDTPAFSLVQVAGGPWPGELPEVVLAPMPLICTITDVHWIAPTYIVRKAATDEAIGVLLET